MNKLNQIKNLLGEARDALQLKKYHKAQTKLENAMRCLEALIEVGDNSIRKGLSREAQKILDEGC